MANLGVLRGTVPEAGIKGRDKSLHPADTNYMTLPLMPDPGITLR